MNSPLYPRGTFKSSGEDARHAQENRSETPQTLSASYQLAFLDHDFLVSNSLRPVRLQLEMIKTETVLAREGIDSTVVIFGSARLPNPEAARLMKEEAEKRLLQNPEDPKAQKEWQRAEKALEMSHFYEESRKLARLISLETDAKNLVIMTGGGGGIMEAANRGAHDVGAKNIGLNIVLPHEQQPNPYITPELCFQFHYFAVRKMHFLYRAKALVAFPGGLGTLDELFEALTLAQTEKMKKIPIILFGEAFWRKLINFDYLVELGTISPEDLSLFQYVDTAEEAWEVIRKAHAAEQR